MTGLILAILLLVASLAGFVVLFAFLAAGKRADEFHDRLANRIQWDQRGADELVSVDLWPRAD